MFLRFCVFAFFFLFEKRFFPKGSEKQKHEHKHKQHSKHIDQQQTNKADHKADIKNTTRAKQHEQT